MYIFVIKAQKQTQGFTVADQICKLRWKNISDLICRHENQKSFVADPSRRHRKVVSPQIWATDTRVGDKDPFKHGTGMFVGCLPGSDVRVDPVARKKCWPGTFLYDWTLRLFQLNFIFLSCHNDIHILCLGLGTETSWLGSGEYHGSSLKIPALVTLITDVDAHTSFE